MDDDISLLGMIVGLAVFGLAAWLGHALAGWGGALGGSLAGATALVVMHHRRRARQPRALPLRNLEGLSPEQAIGLLGAMQSSKPDERKMPAFKSEVVQELETALAETEGEPRAALARVEQLRDRHPRSAAVWAELVRRRLAIENPDEAWQALGRALELALDGGMNSMAARLAAEFPEGVERAELDERLRHRLQRAMQATKRE